MHSKIGILIREGKTVYYIYTSKRYVEFYNLAVAQYAAEQCEAMGE